MNCRKSGADQISWCQGSKDEQKGTIQGDERRRPDSNRGMMVLQTIALPLGYGAGRLKI